MATLQSRGYSAQDAADFKKRSSQPHSLEWKASSYRWRTGGGEDTLWDGLPIVGGTLTLDASDPVRRRLTLEVADVPRPTSATDSALVPYGQFLRLWSRIDRADGTWFPWLKQGEYPITSYVYEWPSTHTTVEASDYSGRVEEYLYLAGHAYKGVRLSDAVQGIVNEALPNRIAATPPGNIWDTAKTIKLTNYVADAGTGRWSVASDMCAVKGAECLFDSNGDLVIRRALADADGISGPSNGPDIGTRANPVGVVTDGPAGNLVAMTGTITREGGCNRVRFILHPTKTVKAGQEKTDPYKVQFVDAEVSAGPAMWGDAFGYLPIVISRHVQLVTADVRATYQARANNIKFRRRGIIRYIDIDAVGLYWLEPDDTVQIKWTQGGTQHTEDHYVAKIAFDLLGQSPTRLTTRSLAVEDPGA